MFIEIRLCKMLTYVFEGRAKIVKIFMVKFNGSVLNRLKIMCGFFLFVSTKKIYKHNDIFDKIVTKLFTLLTKCFFPYLNLTSYLNIVSKEKITFKYLNQSIGSDAGTHIIDLCNKMF